MEERKFKVIKGGAELHSTGTKRYFISAYTTDTRLMGVIGVFIHWKLSGSPNGNDFYQFFYYDAEEYGLESYTGLLNADSTQVSQTEKALMGGLGGKNIELTEKEARWLIKKFAEGSRRLNTPLPEPQSEYRFLLDEPVSVTLKEEEAVIAKICTPLLSDYHLIHYFLMRCFARDKTAQNYLTLGELDTDSIFSEAPATLCQNSINEYIDETGNLSYLCESLIEINNAYKLILTEITIADGKISSAQLCSSLRITATEAAMMLNRPEFVTVYEILTDADNFEQIFSTLTIGSMLTSHENGRLYLQFNANNDHVNRKIFRLNEDIHGMFFVSDFGQLIAAAYGLNEIHDMERMLHSSPLAPYLLPSARYEFKEPILYEFIQSDFEDFAEFLESLQQPQ